MYTQLYNLLVEELSGTSRAYKLATRKWQSLSKLNRRLHNMGDNRLEPSAIKALDTKDKIKKQVPRKIDREIDRESINYKVHDAKRNFKRNT